MPMNVLCPHCNATIKASRKQAGETVPCPRCQNPFQLPVLTQTPSIPTPAQGAGFSFSDDPEPSYAGPTREPWFYGFLETYAKAGLWLGIIVCGGATVLYAMSVFLWMGRMQDTESVVLFVLTLIFLLFVLLLAILGMCFWTALLLLAVDIGRSLRGIHKNVRP